MVNDGVGEGRIQDIHISRGEIVGSNILAIDRNRSTHLQLRLRLNRNLLRLLRHKGPLRREKDQGTQNQAGHHSQ